MPRAKITLAQDSPDVAIQWDYEKNYPLIPDDVTPGSSKKMWWKCDHDHSWEAVIKNRTKRNSGCPYCSGRKASNDTNISVTFPEFFDAMKRFGDQEVSPESLKRTSRTIVLLKCGNGHTWESSPHELSSIKGDLCPYCSNREVLTGFNDLETTHPDVAALWDKEANGFSASQVIARLNHNGKPYHWTCKNGHSWQRHMESAVKHPGCPVCSGREIVFGENDMSVFAPELYEELSKEYKNPENLVEIFPNSNFKISWVCPKGHGEYKSSMAKRLIGQGCPVCSGNTLITGINDLATKRPDLLSEWDYNKNDILPTSIAVGNAREKVWWVCEKNHSYETSVSKRSNGTGCPYCSNKKVLTGYNDLTTHYPNVAQQWDNKKNNTSIAPSLVVSGSGVKRWWKCEKGHSWEISPYRRTVEKLGCPKCSHKVSHPEQEVAEYIANLIGENEIFTSDHSLLGKQEIDIYIPERNIAIEFNGLYWHTEDRGKDRNYHYNKWKMCKDKGIQLITIWEDEWRDKQVIVKSMLAHKLGISQDERVFARNTFFSSLESPVAREFLDSNHIQGPCFASAHFGLYDDSGDLIAVSSWRKNKSTLYLERYATSCAVVGGMGKLLKEGVILAKDLGCDAIVTFADHQVSNSGLYETLGFKKDKDLSPDYKYVIRGERIHKFNYRIARFQEDPNLHYVEGMTERELAQLNGIDRVWDCGKTRWVMEV